MNTYQKVAVHAYIKRSDGKFLILHRSSVNDYLSNLYDFPGGSIEFGETPEKALDREILEETGLKVKIIKPVFIFTELQKDTRHQFWLIYECKYLGGDIKLNPSEHDEYRWTDTIELKTLPQIIFLQKFIETADNEETFQNE